MAIQPRLKTYDLTMIVVGLVIGMGIFRTPAEVAAKAGTQEIFFAAWMLGAVVSMIGSITFAEIGSRHPMAGGFYGIFSICYHPAFAFMVNWIIVVSNAVSTAAVAIMGSEYLAPIILPEYGELGIQLVSIGSLLVLYGINMLGFKLSAIALNGLMLVKLLLIALIMMIGLLGLGKLGVAAPEHAAATTLTTNSIPWGAFFLCFIPVFFTYGGYQQTINFGGDVVEPAKSIPRAVVMGLLVVLIAYLGVNYAYTEVIGFEKLKSSSTLAADVISKVFGPTGHLLVSVLMFMSVMAYVNVSLMSNPRVYHAMSHDGVLPSVFGRVNPKTQVQEYGVSFFCLVIFVVLFFLSSFERILGFVMFFDSISIMAAAAAIFVLRRREMKQVVKSEAYRMWGYPLLPAFFIVIYGAVSFSVMYADPQVYLVGMILFLSGFPLFLLMKRLVKKVNAIENGPQS